MKPWWQREPTFAWALILFFPLGLWLMWNYAPWRIPIKWAWTAGFAALVAIFIVAGATSGDAKQSTAQANRAPTTPSITQSATAAPAETTPSRSSAPAETPAAAEISTPDGEVDTEADTSGVSVAAAAPSGVALPDPNLTPGDVFSVTTAQICVSGYSSSVRSVSTATKNEVYADYHIASHVSGQYEVDHLIPLELGGSNSIKNLWPEPAQPEPGFHQKDLLENKLHALVCAGALDLGVAQRAIATNWYTAYLQYELGGPAPPSPASNPSAPPPPPPAPPPESVPPASTGGVTFTSVVGGPPGGHASASVSTAPGANCTISYVTPAGTHSTAQGLIPKTADATGSVSWTWNIGGNTRPGTGTVTVTCGSVSASAAITIG